MKILLLGSGGREHALAWKISQSAKCEKLFIAPGNAGTLEVGENVPMKADDFESIKIFVLRNRIEMVVVGPEDPLVKGIYDYFKNDVEWLKDNGYLTPEECFFLNDDKNGFRKIRNLLTHHQLYENCFEINGESYHFDDMGTWNVVYGEYAPRIIKILSSIIKKSNNYFDNQIKIE